MGLHWENNIEKNGKLSISFSLFKKYCIRRFEYFIFSLILQEQKFTPNVAERITNTTNFTKELSRYTFCSESKVEVSF